MVFFLHNVIKSNKRVKAVYNKQLGILSCVLNNKT